MEKYLLNEEKIRINNLISELQSTLKIKNLQDIQDNFLNVIKNNKDASIQDILDYYLNCFIDEMNSLLYTHTTPGLQFGIKNNYFCVSAYGGRYNGNSDKGIDKDTLFSFDSISKLITSILTMQEVRNKEFSLNTTIHEYSPEYDLDATFESILKFTALLKTEKRIDNLSSDETLEILKRVRENLGLKQQYKNYYEYNDIGYMIIRQCIHDFEEKLNNLIEAIDGKNLTYKNYLNKENITGGKLGEEYSTPDTKGRGIPFPGHTGLYGNIEGLLNLFYQTMFTETILSGKEKEILFRQPYDVPINYKNSTSEATKYTTKVAGIYIKPTGISGIYDKLASSDMSNRTTDNASVATGTCGSWVVGDNLNNHGVFGNYVGGILTNPYSAVESGMYGNKVNRIPNTPIEVNSKGVILGYSRTLNPYKELITKYGLILELLTEYIKESDSYGIDRQYKRVKKIV